MRLAASVVLAIKKRYSGLENLWWVTRSSGHSFPRRLGMVVVDLGADLVLQLASPLQDFLDMIVLAQTEVIGQFELPRLGRFRGLAIEAVRAQILTEVDLDLLGLLLLRLQHGLRFGLGKVALWHGNVEPVSSRMCHNQKASQLYTTQNKVEHSKKARSGTYSHFCP